ADSDGRASIDLGVYGVPETFVIDKAGRIRYRHPGVLTPDIVEREIRPLLAIAAAAPVRAIEPQEQLADSALEARARELGQQLRCLVCQNQSIDDSNADLARDLRTIV